MMRRAGRRRARIFKVRKGQGSVALTKAEFRARIGERFYDPAFDAVRPEMDAVIETAWDGYHRYRKSPRKRKAGRGFARPGFELPVEWLETRQRLLLAGKRQKDPASPSRILLICGAARSDQTCPGEMSKTFRLLTMARRIVERARRFETDVLDLSRLTSEYGRVIHPCKACVSTAMPLCNWPCSCYPNHAMGQVSDWMAEIYEKWAAAHGVMILTPVYWYGAPSPLKLMMDRLVCADGGNPDPTSTGGKNPEKAKRLELRGWHYPKHLAGRAFAVVVHGDAAGVDTLRRGITDWLIDMELVQAGASASIGRFVGFYKPYATSHEDLDADAGLHEEVRNAARSLIQMVRTIRGGRYLPPDRALRDPRPK